MTRIRARVARTAVILAPALALAFCAGTGPALAAPQSGGPASTPAAGSAKSAGVTFHPLSLAFGWQSAQAQYGTGDPAIGVSRGVGYLAGSLELPGGDSASPGNFSDLGPGSFPPSDLDVPMYTWNGGEGQLHLSGTGQMDAFRGGATVFSSLAGVSFPVSLPLHKLTLMNGWTAVKSQPWGDPSVAIGNGVAYLTGMITRPSGSSSTFAALPKAYRPSRDVQLPLYSFSNTTVSAPQQTASLDISPSGKLAVLATSPAAATGFSLGGVTYPVTLKSQKLTLGGGWQPVPGAGNPGITLSHGVVYLSGQVQRPSGNQEQLAQLPAADRPVHLLYFPVATSGGTEGSVFITPQGQVYAFGPTVAAFTSLASVHYPLGS